MDIASAKSKIFEFFKKYRYVAIVVIAGLVLMALPTTTQKHSSSAPVQEVSDVKEPTVNEYLAEILSKVKGAGKVQILLTVSAGEEIIYQTDDNVSASNETSQIDTVIITDSQRNQSGLIRQVNPPKYRGAVIVCEGAESATVRYALIDAVSKVTGLGADRISVLKMK